MKQKLILSCEHAGNSVPGEFKKLFKTRKWLLKTHRGYDPGAGEIARLLAAKLKLKLFRHQYTRLLVDVNRTLEQNTLYSNVTKKLSDQDKVKILNKYYFPYRKSLLANIKSRATKSQVFHLSVHSFTPVMKGHHRTCDIGLLYKNSDPRAVKIASQIKQKMNELNPRLTVKLNYPYDAEEGGIMNAIKADLLKSAQKNYSGLYIEVNQRIAKKKAKEISQLLFQSIRECL